MPDKHEVGGSSPLGPTKHTNVCRQKCVTEGISYLAESDSSTWANQTVKRPQADFVKFLKHLIEIKCFKNLMKN